MKTSKKGRHTNHGTASNTPDKVPEGSAACAPLPYQQVAERAYFLYLNQGCPCGQEQEHWFEAEAQLAAEARQPGGDVASEQS